MNIVQTGRFFHRGALRSISVIAGTLLFVSLVPFFGSIFLLISPLPVVYYWSTLERKEATVVVAVALVAVSLVEWSGARTNLSVLWMIALSGIAIAEVLKRGFPLNRSVVTASLVLMFSGIAFLTFSALKVGLSPWAFLERYVAALIQANIRIYSQLNIAEEQLQMIRENAEVIADFFTGITPALALSAAVLTVCLNVIALRALLRRKGSSLADFGDLTRWQAPEKLVWILIAGGGMILLSQGVGALVGMNLVILCGLLYLFQGMAIVVFFFRRKGVPPLLRWLVYILILIQQYMLIFVIALGLFDLWIDFRKRMSETKGDTV